MNDWFGRRGALTGTVAIVTGGAGGLGGAITRDLAANGVRVAVIDIDDHAAGDLADELGDQVLVRAGDVRDDAELARLFDDVDATWGRLDTLVNVPGGTFKARFTDTNAKGWNAILRQNLVHVFRACSLAIPRMIDGGRGGAIVNITTVEAHRAAPGYAVYGAAKAAVEHLSRTLAVELAADGIRVNTVAPDYTPTPNMLAHAGVDPDQEPPFGKRISIPMGRGGTVEEVAGCVVFLASGLSSYLTGSTLHVDGGTHASSGWFDWPGTGFSNSVPDDVQALIAEVERSPDRE